MRALKLIQQKKTDPKRLLNQIFDQAEAEGMPITHEGTTYHLQCRPTDRTNWLGVKAMAEMLPNDTDTVTIMTYENVPIVLNKPTTLTTMVQIGQYSQALYAARWATRQAINENLQTNVKETFEQALAAILTQA
jgi:hypothetical protein